MVPLRAASRKTKVFQDDASLLNFGYGTISALLWDLQGEVEANPAQQQPSSEILWPCSQGPVEYRMGRTLLGLASLQPLTP
jgi:hypothetical protein